MAHDYNRTVVFTIHQPRSNIVSLFDQLLILAQGKTVYSGPYAQCGEYFEKIGYPCPPGFNIADYLSERCLLKTPYTSLILFTSVDLTMKEETPAQTGDEPAPPVLVTTNQARDEEIGLGQQRNPRRANGNSVAQTPADEPTNPLAPRAIKQKVSQVWDRLSVSGASQASTKPMNPKLAALISSYASSDIAASIQAEIVSFSGNAASGTATPVLPDVEGEVRTLRNRTRASWGTQFRILSGRAFKNLYRDPALLTAHYASSIVIARGSAQ